MKIGTISFTCAEWHAGIEESVYFRHAATCVGVKECDQVNGDKLKARAVSNTPRFRLIRRPTLSMRVGGSHAVQAIALSIKPTPNADFIVRTGKITDNENEEVDSMRNRVRLGGIPGARDPMAFG